MPSTTTKFHFVAPVAFTLAVGISVVGCMDSSRKSAGQTGDTLPEFSSGGSASDVARGSLPAASGRAVAKIASGNVTGAVTFLQSGDHLTFVADISGLAPGSQEDFYLSRSGGVSESDMQTGRKLGNLVADANGHAHVEGTVMNTSITDTNPIVNWSVVVRGNPNAVGVVKLAAEQ